MPFQTDPELTQIVADALKIPVGTLPPQWTRIISGANATAYLNIRGALIQRGYAADQVDDWDRGAEFQRDLGLYWSLVRGAGLHSYDDRWVNKLDRRKELETCLVELAGDPQPASFDPGGVEHGTMSTDDDTFKTSDVW